VNKLIFLFLISIVSVQAETMFLLTKVPKVYLVVENYSSKVSMDVKKEILDEMKTVTDELKIDTSGYSHRTLGFMLYDTTIDNHLTLNIDLVLGEEVKRLDDNQEVYALTYEKRKQISLENKSAEEIHEQLIDNIYLLLNEFTEQYRGDNI
jgi:hypothetical protein